MIIYSIIFYSTQLHDMKIFSIQIPLYLSYYRMFYFILFCYIVLYSTILYSIMFDYIMVCYFI